VAIDVAAHCAKRGPQVFLGLLEQTDVLKTSSLYQTSPMGSDEVTQGQSDYINAVVKLETGMQPEVLLNALQTIENNHQRQRQKRWGARTLDLDILMYGDLEIETARLSIPHPGITGREFVLVPLIEIEANLEIPGKGGVNQYIQHIQHRPIKRVGDAINE